MVAETEWHSSRTERLCTVAAYEESWTKRQLRGPGGNQLQQDLDLCMNIAIFAARNLRFLRFITAGTNFFARTVKVKGAAPIR
jgi:hypothetical protein